MSQRQLRRFNAIDDAGERYVIIEWEKILESNEIRSDRQRSETVKIPFLETQSGQAVEEQADGIFVILPLNKIVKKV